MHDVAMKFEGAAAKPTICVIVCTRNRPRELSTCLTSLRRSSYPVSEVIVSDDGDDDASNGVVREFGEPAVWTAGPKRGLGPNRNHALTLATASHVLFLDDDASLGERFLEHCVREMQASGGSADTTIVTGVESRPDGHRVTAHEQDFLGYQHRPYRQGETLKTVVINSALFPRSLFARMHFDDQLIYGYDEVDLTSRSVREGFRIITAAEAVNHHDPSAVNRDYYRPRVDAARIYVTAKRRWVTERSPLRAGVFLGVAIPHLLVSALGRRNEVRLSEVRLVTREALRMLWRSRRSLRP